MNFHDIEGDEKFVEGDKLVSLVTGLIFKFTNKNITRSPYGGSEENVYNYLFNEIIFKSNDYKKITMNYATPDYSHLSRIDTDTYYSINPTSGFRIVPNEKGYITAMQIHDEKDGDIKKILCIIQNHVIKRGKCNVIITGIGKTKKNRKENDDDEKDDNDDDEKDDNDDDEKDDNDDEYKEKININVTISHCYLEVKNNIYFILFLFIILNIYLNVFIYSIMGIHSYNFQS